MQQNRQTIENFYAAFARLDHEGMAACYASDAVFEDEVFSLHGKREAAGMWRMLCRAVQSKGRDDWKLEVRDVEAQGGEGQAHWDAQYRFSATGRLVHNSIAARFQFDPQGRILRHRDSFGFWRWSRQALGVPGLLLGWSPMLRKTVRRQAGAKLRNFLAREAAR